MDKLIGQLARTRVPDRNSEVEGVGAKAAFGIREIDSWADAFLKGSPDAFDDHKIMIGLNYIFYSIISIYY